MAAVATRERIIEAGADLFRHQGYAGTGIKRIAETAGAPFGSLYHFFPGGKEELADAVIRRSGAFYLQLFETIVGSSPDVVTGIANLFLGAAATLRATDYADACPIATVALEVASTNEQLRQATAEVFETWISALATRLVDAGVAEARARELAIEAFAALEGAFILSRATRSAIPVEVAGRAIVESLRSATLTTDRTPGALTAREAEVLSLLAGGRTGKEISLELCVSPSTVQRHVANIYTKIGARTRVDAAAYALARGLVRARVD